MVSRLLYTAAYRTIKEVVELLIATHETSNTDAQSCQSAMTVVWVAKRTKQETNLEGLFVLVSSVQVALEEDQLHCHICSAVHQGLGTLLQVDESNALGLDLPVLQSSKVTQLCKCIQQSWLGVLRTCFARVMDKRGMSVHGRCSMKCTTHGLYEH